MNVREYISGGIIQSYVLGLANEAERAEFERMCEQYPEVRTAREAFELSLEQFALGNQVSPPSNVKGKIFAAIDIESQTNLASAASGLSPAGGSTFREAKREGEPRSTKLFTLPKFQRLLSAAAVVLLLISTALNFYFFNQAKQYSQQYRELLTQQTEMVSNNQVLQTRMLEYEKAMEWMKDPDMVVIKMPAMPDGPDPTSATTVYWNSITKDVFLAINKLPIPAADQQYQLWAMVDGKPVDAGVFDIKEGPGMIKMKNIPRAQAFAITLEKKGGSSTPTMEKLYVLGKV
ncbi:MAG: anti-sigma factor [Chitinophagaceae bacterium]|nr:anti-sigma factor [Chitinophagaceae bacterium]